MIQIQFTPNYTGLVITGDSHDFQALVDAIYTITIDEDDTKYSHYLDNSIRLLGLAYDLRHAAQGDRHIEMADNGVGGLKDRDNPRILPVKNVHFSFEYFYPELVFDTMAINELLEVYMNRNSKPKNDYRAATNKANIWDINIAMLRQFQAVFSNCMKEELTPASFSRWNNLFNDDRYSHALTMYNQFIDKLNIDFINMKGENRQKKLLAIAKQITKPYDSRDYSDLEYSIREGVREYDCRPSDLHFPHLEYPEEIEW